MFLAWFSIAFAGLCVGLIALVVRGDPVSAVRSWGFSDFGTFALTLHAFGMVLAVALLARFLRHAGLSFCSIGLRGRVPARIVPYVIVALLVDYLVLYPVAKLVLGAAGLSMFWGAPVESFDLVVLNPLSMLDASQYRLGSALDFWAAAISAVVIAPLAEEILFRGYVLNMFRERGFRLCVAILFSVVIFASIHVFFGPGMVMYTLIWALIPTWLYLKSGSLWPAICYHSLNNAIAYVLLPLLAG